MILSRLSDFGHDVIDRVLNILVALDQLVFALITLGSSAPDETISAAAWRLESKGKLAGAIFRPLIDALFYPIQKHHCYLAYLAESRGYQQHHDYKDAQ
jgi:hypothetical protein